MNNYVKIIISMIFIWVFGLACQTKTPLDDNSFEIARLKPQHKSGTRNVGFAGVDSETLDAGRSVAMAEIEGSAVINHIHMTKNFYFMFGGPKHTTSADRSDQDKENRPLAVEGDVFTSRALLIKEMPEEERRALAARP